MIPIFLDPSNARIALVGRGAQTVRRLGWLVAAGARPDVWSDEPTPDLAAAVGARLERRLPTAAECAAYHAIWIADLPAELAQPISAVAREARVLVNVEDVVPLCDFHTPAVVRRGKLTLAVGTGGASPAVARVARERLEAAFPPGWGEALDEIAEARARLRADGASFDTLSADARRRLSERGLS